MEVNPQKKKLLRYLKFEKLREEEGEEEEKEDQKHDRRNLRFVTLFLLF